MSSTGDRFPGGAASANPRIRSGIVSTWRGSCSDPIHAEHVGHACRSPLPDGRGLHASPGRRPRGCATTGGRAGRSCDSGPVQGRSRRGAHRDCGPRYAALDAGRRGAHRDYRPRYADSRRKSPRCAPRLRPSIRASRRKSPSVRTEIPALDTRLSTQVAEACAPRSRCLDTRLSTQVAGVRTEIAGLDTRLSTRIAEARTEVANLETRLVRWMVGTVIATAGVTVGILRLFG